MRSGSGHGVQAKKMLVRRLLPRLKLRRLAEAARMDSRRPHSGLHEGARSLFATRSGHGKATRSFGCIAWAGMVDIERKGIAWRWKGYEIRRCTRTCTGMGWCIAHLTPMQTAIGSADHFMVASTASIVPSTAFDEASGGNGCSCCCDLGQSHLKGRAHESHVAEQRKTCCNVDVDNALGSVISANNGDVLLARN